MPLVSRNSTAERSMNRRSEPPLALADAGPELEHDRQGDPPGVDVGDPAGHVAQARHGEQQRADQDHQDDERDDPGAQPLALVLLGVGAAPLERLVDHRADRGLIGPHRTPHRQAAHRRDDRANVMCMRTGLGRLLSMAIVLAGVLPAAAGAATGPPFSVRTLHFDTVVGPANDTHCDVIGDLYTPASATPATPAPAVLTTNGFGGSKDDQKAMAQALAQRGYVVLSYSGLGFGGSGCKIQLDDPDWDGKAGSQLVSFLGGTKAATDGTTIHDVQLDAPGDPRLGMIGGSYGGQIQYAIAGQDPRVDTIIPIITWNDLAYSLTPNNTDLTTGVTSATPGVAKYQWAALFTGVGIANGVQNIQADPSRDVTTCPNFDARVCPGVVEAGITGTPSPTTLAMLRHASVSTYIKNIKIPTLLLQGEGDTLFNLNEAVATYQSLRAQGTPVKMVWQSWGHSHSAPAPGELGQGAGGYSPVDAAGNMTAEGRVVEEWLGHYLRGEPAAPALDFTYFRDWIRYSGDASPAYGRSASYPAGPERTFRLSGTDALAPDGGAVQPGAAAFTTPPAGAPTSVTEISAVSQDVPLFDAPGTYAQYTSPPLAADTDVVGMPRARLRISVAGDNAAGAATPAALTTLFLKVQDVAPDGTVTQPGRLVAPMRPASVAKPVTVTLPGIVHRFAAGHRIRLVVAGSDAAYRGSPVPAAVTITTDRSDPGTLTVPVASAPATAQGSVAQAAVPARACASRRGLTVHVKRGFRPRLRTATVLVDGKRVATITRAASGARLSLGGRKPGTVVVRIVMTLRNGKHVSDLRRYRLCTAKATATRRR
jgi:ABC-2 type transport system ATP-binding protein